MKILVLYISTVAIFFAADAIGLRLLIKPVFERHVAHLFADPFRVVPATLFYLGTIIRQDEDDWALNIYNLGHSDFAEFNNPEHHWNKDGPGRTESNRRIKS